MQNSQKKWFGITFVIVLLASFLATQPLHARTAGDVVDDSIITTKVKALLFDEDLVRGLKISVKTYDGEVTLTGGVESVEQKQRAEEIARSVDGVREVNNLLKIEGGEEL